MSQLFNLLGAIALASLLTGGFESAVSAARISPDVSRKPLDVQFYCWREQGGPAVLGAPADVYAWRCDPRVAANRTACGTQCSTKIDWSRACLKYGSEWIAAYRSRSDPDSLFCYNGAEQRSARAKLIGRSLAGYIKRNYPPEAYARLQGRSFRNLLLQGVAGSIAGGGNADDPSAADIPDLSDPDGAGQIAIEVWNYNHPDEKLETLPSPRERVEKTVSEWLSGRQTWDEAVERNFGDLKQAAQTAREIRSSEQARQESSRQGGSGSDTKGDGRESRDPNSGIGRNGPDKMEAGTPDTRGAGEKSFGEKLKEAAEKERNSQDIRPR